MPADDGRKLLWLTKEELISILDTIIGNPRLMGFVRQSVDIFYTESYASAETGAQDIVHLIYESLAIAKLRYLTQVAGFPKLLDSVEQREVLISCRRAITAVIVQLDVRLRAADKDGAVKHMAEPSPEFTVLELLRKMQTGDLLAKASKEQLG